MSTGQEHYREAERLIGPDLVRMAKDTALATGNVAMAKHNIEISIATAQVHATLALAAATIAQSNRHTDDWSEVLS